MVETKQQTLKEWLQDVANTDTSSERDSRMMENLLHRVGFPSARVVVGIVYLEGKGTMEAPPTSIHSIARMLLKGGN